MRFPARLHWSEGQFMQQHHFQEQDRIAFLQQAAERGFYLFYPEGLMSLKLNYDALRARRVVIEEFSALMDDGLTLSLPGNCELQPLTLSPESLRPDEPITVYLAVPSYSTQEGNLNEPGSAQRRFSLHEEERADANSGGNETVLITQRICAKLITDRQEGAGCSLLPLMRLRFESMVGSAPILALDDSYLPPYVVLPENCPLLRLVGELSYEIKAARDKIITDLEAQRCDLSMPGGAQLLSLMRLQHFNRALQYLSALMVPERVTPFMLYQGLAELLAGLLGTAPERDQNAIPPYDHYNLAPLFTHLATSIRAFLSTQGAASCLEVAFKELGPHTLVAQLQEEHLIKGRDYFLYLNVGSEEARTIELIEAGDHLRVLDLKSQESRVRGVKLQHLRYPPRYLPTQGDGGLWFKLLREESARMWRYITEDKCVIIDYAPEIFSQLSAKLFLAVIDT